MNLRGYRLAAFASACLVLGPTAVGSADAKDPFVGTWKLNVTKSKFDAGVPPRSSTATITMVGNKRKLAVHTIPAAGPEVSTESVAADDGKDYPMKGSPTVDMVAMTKIDGRTVERKDKKNGRVVSTLRATVSKDGKTMTVKQKGVGAQGQPYSNTLVYDRQ